MTHEFKTPLTNIALAGKNDDERFNSKQEEDKIKHYSGIIPPEENEKLRLQVEQVLYDALERRNSCTKTELDIHQLIQDSV